MSDRTNGSCYASANILPWSADQVKITLFATTMIYYE